jgi:hypothetical protein
VNKYHIRFNTKHGESNLVWRVFENGNEHLVRNVQIKTLVFGEPSMEDGIQKWNLACKGSMTIIDDVAVIE